METKNLWQIVKFFFNFLTGKFVVRKDTKLVVIKAGKETENKGFLFLSTSADMFFIKIGKIVFINRWTTRPTWFKVIDWGKSDKDEYSVRLGGTVVEFRIYKNLSWHKLETHKFNNKCTWYDFGRVTLVIQDANQWMQEEIEKMFDC